LLLVKENLVKLLTQVTISELIDPVVEVQFVSFGLDAHVNFQVPA
jgi:hypothetical protein